MAKKIEVEITGDSRSLERAFGRAQRSGSKFGKFAKVGIGAALTGIGVAAVGVGVAFKRGFDEVAESQKVAAQTAAVLKSTGGVAGVTAKHVDTLANSLSELSGVDDEAIASSENLLLTFKNIQNEAGKGNDIFDQASKAVLDMSVAMGTDLQSSTIQVGKALNDPVKGLTALTRVGVTFSDKQKDLIERLVETGQKAKAQKIILRELKSEFGGSAKAAGDTLPGQLSKLGNKFDELSGRVVEKMVPALLAIVEAATQVLDWAEKNWPRFRAAIVNAIDAVRPTFERLVNYWTTTLLPTIQQVIEFARAMWARFGEDIKRNLMVAVSVIRNILNIIKGVVELVMALIRGDWSAAWGALKSIARNALQGVVTLLKNMVTNFLHAAKALGGAIKDGIVAGLRGLAGLVASAARGAINALIDAFNSLASFTINVPGFFPGPSSYTIDPQNIPHVATGGHVARSGLAVIHRGEDVIPARVGARSGGGSGRFLVLTDAQGVAFLQSLNQRHARGNGGRPIW